MYSETAAQVLFTHSITLTLDIILKVFTRLGGKEIIGDLGLPFLSHLNRNHGAQSGMQTFMYMYKIYICLYSLPCS